MTTHKGAKRGRITSEINITPFTDVVLVLLIIFMMTTPLLFQPEIKIKLPTAKKAETETDKTVNVMIDTLGSIYVDNTKVDLEGLKAVIASKISSRPDIPVIIKADKEVKYDVVMQTIDASKQAGAKVFALGVEVTQDKKQ
jgi:biopolymer transport protein TolR